MATCSLNIAKAMDSPNFEKTVETAIRGLTGLGLDEYRSALDRTWKRNVTRDRVGPDEPVRVFAS